MAWDFNDYHQSAVLWKLDIDAPEYDSSLVVVVKISSYLIRGFLKIRVK